MGRLSILIIFYWVMLIENGTDWLGILFDFGNGLEIRYSLIIKVFFLFFNLMLFLVLHKKIIIINAVLIFCSFLLLSTLYVLFLYPKFFLGALSANLHIQLVFNIILFIYLSANNENQIRKFYNGLRLFGLINAILVIISYFAPDLTTFFEAGVANSGVKRAFGIMGDEVSLFLTFFFYDAIIFRKYYKSILFFVAILCTGGIGAFITLMILLGYYLIFVLKISRRNASLVSFFILFIIILSVFSIDKVQELSVVKRIENNIRNPKEETGNLRILSLTTAFEMISERPLLGYGYGSYSSVVFEKYEGVYKALGQGSNYKNVSVILGSSFNPYIQLICETGILGLFLYVGLLRKFLKYCKSGMKTESHFISHFKKVSFGWLLVFFITCITANWMLPASFLFLLVVTLAGLNLKLNFLNSEH